VSFLASRAIGEQQDAVQEKTQESKNNIQQSSPREGNQTDGAASDDKICASKN
jgi:hypothetical protein